MRAAAVIVLIFAAAALRASPAQDLRDTTPAELRTGRFVMEAQVYNGATDGSWVKLHLNSRRGWFGYRLERVGGASAVAPAAGDIPRPAGAVPSREIAWNEINQDRFRAGSNESVWLEGTLTRVEGGGATLEGILELKDGPIRARLHWLEHSDYGLNPPPTFAGVAYGADPRQVMDVYLAGGRKPAPVAVFFHGGGWYMYDRTEIEHYPYHALLEAGISVVSVEYRYCPRDNIDSRTPAVSVPMLDCAHALQFVRSHAQAWGMSAQRVGVWGESAGACTALWLGTHPDLARSGAPGPAGESTRPWCVAAVNPQTSLDPRQMREWAGPNFTYGAHAFGIAVDGHPRASFEAFLAARARLLPMIEEYSPAALVRRDGPPIFMDFVDIPIGDTRPMNYTHSPKFGLEFRRLCRRTGRECYLSYEGSKDPHYGDWLNFLVARLNR